MIKKFLIAASVAVAITACSSEDVSKPAVVQDVTAESSNPYAVFLADGTGISFNKPAVSDVIREDETSKIRILTYEFDEEYTDVDSSLSTVLEAASYSRTVNDASGSYDSSIIYRKQDVSPVLARYKVAADEEISKKTNLVLSWRFN